jgi:hypothetical protein
VVHPAFLAAEDPDPLRSRVLASYDEGVRALRRLGLDYVDWTLPVEATGCPAIDLAGHLLDTARSCHRLLDAALAGLTPPRVDSERALVCRAAIRAVRADRLVTGADRMVAFDAVATRYGERIAETDPDMRIGVWDAAGQLGLVRHCLLVALEWHLHAWDLAGALGWDHQPADPDLFADGLPYRPDPPPGGPWVEVLAIAGRFPPTAPRPGGP